MEFMVQLMTQWGKAVQKDHVLQEYPRPNLVRDSYLNLNGPWQYAITKTERTNHWDGEILVPYSPETQLSGVGHILQPGEYLHYRKEIRLAPGFCKGRVLLHFGAVDQECQVFWNGTLLGSHKGGYLPFSFDVTAHLAPGSNVLTLCVQDATEHLPHARGKQKLQKKGKYASLFYTPQSGIWKTVWMESVPQDYVQNISITPQYDNALVALTVQANRDGLPVQVTVQSGGQTVAEAKAVTGQQAVLPLPGFWPWCPADPHLYDVTVCVGEDRVQTYFGMRKFAAARDKNGILRFTLNDKPFFFNGLLDQGYWPESLLTPPSDDALLYDILKLKELGYNTIRKHIKVEDARFYYHCDRLGMVVWQDMPNGGGEYNMGFVTYLPNAFNWFARGVKDSHYRLFGRADEAGRAQYGTDLRGLVRHLYNYPCIAVWVPFNEGWGQFDARAATATIREIDTTRLINEACGWFDQGGGDMYSIHNYVHKLKVRPQPGRVVALTEYGGYAYPVAGHMACEKEFGYQFYRSSQELTENYRRLWQQEILPNVKNGLCSAIYTQTSDVEEEVNGLMTYDRAVDKLDAAAVQQLNRQLDALFEELT